MGHSVNVIDVLAAMLGKRFYGAKLGKNNEISAFHFLVFSFHLAF